MRNITMKIKGAPISAPFLSVDVADDFLSRFMGLMGRKTLPPGHGLLLSPCSSVHMCFMRFAIDVIYLDENSRVLKVVGNLPPWTGLSICGGAHSVLEMTAGEAAHLGILVGDVLEEIN